MHSRVIVALDYADAGTALALCEKLSPGQCRLKVGKELFTAAGPELVATLARRGFDVFLDLKFHDIPNTVAQACRTAAQLGVWMLNVHALGGRPMMQAAREAIGSGDNAPKLVAVTILTSMGAAELGEVGIVGEPADAVGRPAALARDCGLDGVVCSAQEASLIRQRFGDAFLRVTPGIRLAGAAGDDQKRIMTPVDAIRGGASFLVIGRPVTRAENPAEVLDRINREISARETAS
jgi:orotidine-5'-phosphate decarboxylase